MIKNILTIAGSDPSGGAGIQADLKTFTALGTYGMATITALTAQNTQNVSDIHEVPADFVAQQLTSIFEDIHVDAVKIGMAGSRETVETIAKILTQYSPQHIILDPVMVSTSGTRLITGDAIQAIQAHLVPLATLITPNIPEAEILGALAQPTLTKGGHDTNDQAIDTLRTGGKETEFKAPRIHTKNTHGTGCTLSAAIAVYLAKGLNLETAIREAKHYLTQAIHDAEKLNVGKGHGPVNHIWNHKE